QDRTPLATDPVGHPKPPVLIGRSEGQPIPDGPHRFKSRLLCRNTLNCWPHDLPKPHVANPYGTNTHFAGRGERDNGAMTRSESNGEGDDLVEVCPVPVEPGDPVLDVSNSEIVAKH